MISKRGGNAPWAVDLEYVVEKKQILCKPLYCTWQLNTDSTEQQQICCISNVVGKLYLGLIHVSSVISHFSSSLRVQLCIGII